MSNQLEKEALIKVEILDQAHYLESFLTEAYRLQLLSAKELHHLQREAVTLLARQTKRYTMGDSSSIQVEAAQGLMQSIFYGIGHYLKSLPDTEQALLLLKQEKLAELYRRGLALLNTSLMKAQTVHQAVLQNRLVIDNLAYHDTLDQAIPNFFLDYDPEFGAQETMASIDYPLAIDQMILVGIEYIEDYLQKIYWENHFCHYYQAEDLASLLYGYDHSCSELLVNIFQLTLTNALGSVLCGVSAKELTPKKDSYAYLQQLAGKSAEDLRQLLHVAAEKIAMELEMTSPFLQAYLVQTAEEIAPSLHLALGEHRLEQLFIGLEIEQQQAGDHYQDGQKLEDEAFREVVEAIRQCALASEKVMLISQSIHSLADLVDLLATDCLFDEDYTAVFEHLDNLTLVMLQKRLRQSDNALHSSAAELEWQARLRDYLDAHPLEEESASQ